MLAGEVWKRERSLSITEKSGFVAQILHKGQGLLIPLSTFEAKWSDPSSNIAPFKKLTLTFLFRWVFPSTFQHLIV